MGKVCSRQRKQQQNVTQAGAYLADLSVTFNMDGEKGVREKVIVRGRIITTEVIKDQCPLGYLGFVRILASTQRSK